MDIEAGFSPFNTHTQFDSSSIFINGIPGTLHIEHEHLYMSSSQHGIGQPTTTTIPISEILSALPATQPPPQQHTFDLISSCINNLSISNPTHSPLLHFTAHIFTFQRRTPSNPSDWYPLKITISSPDKHIIDEILANISSAIESISTSRPRQLLVILNPNAGSGNALSAFKTIVRPVLSLAGIHTIVHETRYAGHALEIVESVLSAEGRCVVDGIVAIGGDGIFNEVLNGYMKTQYDTVDDDVTHMNTNMNTNTSTSTNSMHIPPVRLAHIPCGSTDAVACSVNGSRSIFTAAMHVALGDSMPLDILKIEMKSPGDDAAPCRPRFASCIATVGFMPDVVHVAEQFTWLMRGTLRYDIVGAFMVARNRSYEYKIEYVELEEEPPSSPCFAGCDVCRAASISQLQRRHHSEGFLMKNIASNEFQDSNKNTWITKRGEYMSIMAINQPCRSDKTPNGMSKFGHLSNGQCSLVLVKKCSPVQYVRFLMCMSSKGLIPGILPDYVDVISTIAVRITKIGEEKHSLWNLDGEIVQSTQGKITSCGGQIHVFARGVNG